MDNKSKVINKIKRLQYIKQGLAAAGAALAGMLVIIITQRFFNIPLDGRYFFAAISLAGATGWVLAAYFPRPDTVVQGVIAHRDFFVCDHACGNKHCIHSVDSTATRAIFCLRDGVLIESTVKKS